MKKRNSFLKTNQTRWSSNFQITFSRRRTVEPKPAERVRSKTKFNKLFYPTRRFLCMRTFLSNLTTLQTFSQYWSICLCRIKMSQLSCKKLSQLITRSNTREHLISTVRPSMCSYRSLEPSTLMSHLAFPRWPISSTSSVTTCKLLSSSQRVWSFKKSSMDMILQQLLMGTLTLDSTIIHVNTSLKDSNTCINLSRFCKLFAVITIQISQPSTLT